MAVRARGKLMNEEGGQRTVESYEELMIAD